MTALGLAGRDSTRTYFKPRQENSSEVIHLRAQGCGHHWSPGFRPDYSSLHLLQCIFWCLSLNLKGSEEAAPVEEADSSFVEESIVWGLKHTPHLLGFS